MQAEQEGDGGLTQSSASWQYSTSSIKTNSRGIAIGRVSTRALCNVRTVRRHVIDFAKKD